MLVITLGLGIWQLERLAWKTALLAGIAQAEAQAPVQLPLRPEPFQRVIVEGRFLPVYGFYGTEVRNGPAGVVMGAQLVGALERPEAARVIVDLGWVPIDMRVDPPAGQQRVVGYVRPAEKASWWGAKDDPVQRRFYTLDPAAIGRTLGSADVAPFTIVALGESTGFPQPTRALPRPPNDHLSYAATWFSLSVALTVVFVLFVRQTLHREAA